MGGRSWYAHCGNDDEWDLWRRQSICHDKELVAQLKSARSILSSGWRGRVRRLAINDTTCLRWKRRLPSKEKRTFSGQNLMVVGKAKANLTPSNLHLRKSCQPSSVPRRARVAH